MEQISIYDELNNQYINKICKLEKEDKPLISKVELDEFTKIAQSNFDFEFDGISKFYPYKMNDKIKNLDFQILVICGASGSGKSTFSKYFGKDESIIWDDTKAIISHFDTPQETCEKLIASGISSVPTWCKPRNVLSVGEGFRADISRKLKNNCVIDEFTSNVDRNVAMSCAKSIGQYIRKNNLQRCVFVSCHKDFIDTLCPDYVIDLDDEYLYDTRRLPQRKFELSLYKGGDKREIWRIFRQHHYMTQDLNEASTMFTLYLDKQIVGCLFVLPLPNGYLKNAWKIHRLVINPDYQGLGLGTNFLLAICDLYKVNGGGMYIRTSHAKLKNYFSHHSDLWEETARSGINCAEKIPGSDKILSNSFKNNIAYSYKYIGNNKKKYNLNYDSINAIQNFNPKEKTNKSTITLFDFMGE